LGAASPYIAKAIQIVGFRTDYPLPHFGQGFLAIFVLMVALGAFWSRALESHNRWLAMYHAATFPIVFQFLFDSHPPA
jgi:hypothetical protein